MAAPERTLTAPNRPKLSLSVMQLMGILNLTPDSFSDGGAIQSVERAVARALEMARAGAMVIDVGGESTRPGAQRVGSVEQMERVVEPIRRIRAEFDDRGWHAVWISIDTTRTDVAEAALNAGASLINDVSAGRDDPTILSLAAQREVPICLMHMLGEPATMQEAPCYDDVQMEVLAFLTERATAARASGVPSDQILLDPGIGFGKRLEDNLALLKGLNTLVEAAQKQGHSVLLGASRKRFISALVDQRDGGDDGEGEATPDVTERLPGTLAVAAAAESGGVHMLRVHDVAEHSQFLAVYRNVHNS